MAYLFSNIRVCKGSQRPGALLNVDQIKTGDTGVDEIQAGNVGIDQVETSDAGNRDRWRGSDYIFHDCELVLLFFSAVKGLSADHPNLGQ